MHIMYIYFNEEKKNKKNKKRETSYSLIYETNSSNYVVISFQKSTDNLETRIKPRANLENRRWHHANSISTEINIPYIDILSLPDLFHVKSHLSFLFTPPCRKFICKYHLYYISIPYHLSMISMFPMDSRTPKKS